MAWRVSATLLRAACSSFVLALGTAGCVEDIRTEGIVPAKHGAIQPSTNGQIITAEEACSRLVAAEKDARKDLRCSGSELPGCPERLRLAGSLVCTDVDEGSVDECVSAMSEYLSCSDFDSHPCVVTVVRDQCTNPFEAGTRPPPPEGGLREGGPGEGGQPEGSTPPPAEGGRTPDAASDAQPVTDAAPG